MYCYLHLGVICCQKTEKKAMQNQRRHIYCTIIKQVAMLLLMEFLYYALYSKSIYCILRGRIKEFNRSITTILCQVGSYRTVVG